MIGMTGCSGDSGAASDELLVLFSAPLSGDSAESGRAMLNGAESGGPDHQRGRGIASGENAGKKIRIEAADDEMTTQAANSIASKFVSDEKYFALAGFLDTGLAQAASVVAARSDLSLISSFGCGDSLVSSAKNVFVMCAAPMRMVESPPLRGRPNSWRDLRLDLHRCSATRVLLRGRAGGGG